MVDALVKRYLTSKLDIAVFSCVIFYFESFFIKDILCNVSLQVIKNFVYIFS